MADFRSTFRKPLSCPKNGERGTVYMKHPMLKRYDNNIKSGEVE
jgi:hypothetical protein